MRDGMWTCNSQLGHGDAHVTWEPEGNYAMHTWPQGGPHRTCGAQPPDNSPGECTGRALHPLPHRNAAGFEWGDDPYADGISAADAIAALNGGQS